MAGGRRTSLRATSYGPVGGATIETVFRLATREDEAELRELCALPIRGDWIDLSYRREPDFFDGLSGQVLVGRGGGQLLAVAVRSLWSVYLDGQPRTVAFLHGLRVRPSHQGKFLLWKGFRLLQELEKDGRTPLCFATVIEGNRLAQALLVERGRPHWPRFELRGRLFTLALEVGRPYPLRAELACEPSLAWGSARQFFPAELAGGNERRSWLVTGRAVAALRDLRASRQTVVAGYRQPLASLRPWINLGARVQRRPRLPAVGEQLAGAYVGYWCLAPGAGPEDFRPLLEGLLEVARRQGLQWLYLGLLEAGPCLELARRYRHRLYTSRLYQLHPPGVSVQAVRPEYLELAAL